MDNNECKQQFSFAYIRAIASAAGYVVSEPAVDEDSIDLTISGKGGKGKICSPKLDLQVKCTSRDLTHSDYLRFPLKKKNYDDLREPRVLVPRILVVVLVPQNINHWLRQSEKELRVHHCAYWYSLRQCPDIINKTSATLSIPRSQVFSRKNLRKLMVTIEAGGTP